MKKLLLNAGFLTLLIIVSCSKKETERAFVKGPSSWTLINATFYATSVKVATATNTITAADNSGVFFSIIFNDLPKVAGTYKIVSNPPKDNECAIAAGQYSNVYSSTGDDAAMAEVSLPGGKIQVKIRGDADGISSQTLEHTMLGCDITETQRE